jgi:hypothetical protein
MTTSAILAISGALCLFFCGFVFYVSVPREGRPPSPWTRTDTRAVASAMLVLTLLLSGITLVLKAIF